MQSLKKTLSKYTEEAIKLPRKFFDGIPRISSNQKWLYSEVIPVFSGLGNIKDSKNWRNITQEDLINVQLVFKEDSKWGYLFYTNDGSFYYSLMLGENFNEYTETFAGEFLDKM